VRVNGGAAQKAIKESTTQDLKVTRRSTAHASLMKKRRNNISCRKRKEGHANLAPIVVGYGAPNTDLGLPFNPAVYQTRLNTSVGRLATRQLRMKAGKKAAATKRRFPRQAYRVVAELREGGHAVDIQ